MLVKVNGEFVEIETKSNIEDLLVFLDIPKVRIAVELNGKANSPKLMAKAMKKAVESGREAFLAGRMEKRLYASASSPEEGTID